MTARADRIASSPRSATSWPSSADADPADKAEIYSQLGLRLTYQPGQRIVRAEAHLGQTPHWDFDSVRGGT